jgi:hypothetical protein
MNLTYFDFGNLTYFPVHNIDSTRLKKSERESPLSSAAQRYGTEIGTEKE